MPDCEKSLEPDTALFCDCDELFDWLTIEDVKSFI